MYGYSFELITGPMSCGKTEELLRRVRRSIIAKRKVKVISPEVDTRAKGDYIESRNGLWLDAIKVKHAIQIMSVVKPEDEVIAIDELQFFDKNNTYVISFFVRRKSTQRVFQEIVIRVIKLGNIKEFIRFR